MLGLGGPIDMGGKESIGTQGVNRTDNILFDADFECGNIDQVR